jgi:hypothetical protein
MGSDKAIEKLVTANVDGKVFEIINPTFFYSCEVPGLGLGLFCHQDLHPGDIWWAHNLNDNRFVEFCYSWQTFEALKEEIKSDVKKKCYVDVETREVIVCTEPFCRVNHGNSNTANADSDESKNSIITKFIPANSQILIPYTYEAVISLVWKFEAFERSLPLELLNNKEYLYSPAVQCKHAMDFLKNLS